MEGELYNGIEMAEILVKMSDLFSLQYHQNKIF